MKMTRLAKGSKITKNRIINCNSLSNTLIYLFFRIGRELRCL
jgi:hypothetical protein